MAGGCHTPGVITAELAWGVTACACAGFGLLYLARAIRDGSRRRVAARWAPAWHAVWLLALLLVVFHRDATGWQHHAWQWAYPLLAWGAIYRGVTVLERTARQRLAARRRRAAAGQG